MVGSCDYYNACSFTFGVPVNGVMTFQSARTGNAFVAFCSYYNYQGYQNYREYPMVKLVSPLIDGHSYRLDFYLNAANRQEYAVSNIGAYFCSNNEIAGFSNQYVIPVTPQIESGDNLFVSDTVSWTLISGTFQANGGEEYLLIGNFRDSSLIHYQYLGDNGFPASSLDSTNYYAVDDVSLVDITPEFICPNVFTPNGDGVNDEFTIGLNAISDFTCNIYNRWGVRIATISNGNNSWKGMDLNGGQCLDGVYFYEVSGHSYDGMLARKSGFVQLLR